MAGGATQVARVSSPAFCGRSMSNWPYYSLRRTVWAVAALVRFRAVSRCVRIRVLGLARVPEPGACVSVGACVAAGGIPGRTLALIGRPLRMRKLCWPL